MSRKRRQATDLGRVFDGQVCAFCGTAEDSEILYGKFFVSDDVCAHANCMFLSSALCQQGTEKEGFLGFLLPEIEAELNRGKKLFCSYCRKRGATIGCCETKCKKSFHLNCGIAHGSLHQFFGSFLSFCKEHKPKQKAVEITEDDLFCYICCEEIPHDELKSCLYSPCCKKNWFHKICLQKYAASAGLYFFKCPLCKNSEEFIEEMKKFGVHIPDKDASWELEENAYQDLLMRPGCDAPTCLCPKGRKYFPQKSSGWTLLACKHCGSHARHKNCGNLKLSTKSWMCEECKLFDEKIYKSKAATLPKIEEKSINDVSVEKCEVEELGQSNNEPSPSDCISPLPVIQKSLALLDIENTTSHPSYHNDIDMQDDKKAKARSKNSVTNVKFSDILGMVVENNFSNLSNNSTNFSQDEQTTNIKDIKTLTLDFLFQKPGVFKKQTVKKVTKKRKIESSSCCGGQNHKCIRKYFGQECGKYRI